MSAGIASCSDDEQMSAASADCTESIGFGMLASRVLDDETFDTFYVYGGFWRATDAWNQTYSPVFVARQYASGLGEQRAVTIRYTVSDDYSSRREYTAKIAPVWEEGRSYAYNIVVGTPDNQSS